MNKKRRGDLFERPVKFVSGCKGRCETEENSNEGITSTECVDKEVYQSKVMGIGLEIMRKMGYKEGVGLGTNGQGIVKPIEVVKRPKSLGLGCKNYNKKAKVTPLQETFDEIKALTQLSEKRKKELTVKELWFAQLDMQIIKCESKNEKEKVVSLRKEKERLIMEVIASVLDQLHDDSHSGNLSLEFLGDLFTYLKKRFPDELKLCGLSTIACSFALPLFSRLFKGWDPLIKPEDHMDVISVWKDLLQGDDISSPYAQLFIEVVFCAVNRSSTNTWQTTNPEPLLHYLDIFERLTHQAALQKILATKYICGSRRMFVSYRKVNEPESMLTENGAVSKIEGKGKVVLKLTSGKDLVLSNVLHVPNITKNLISRPILSNTGFKLVFDIDKFIITKGAVYVGNDTKCITEENVTIN